MKDKRVSGNNRGGWRRHGDPPAWLDETLPLEERRRLLDRAIRAIAPSQQQAPTTHQPDAADAQDARVDGSKDAER